MMAFYCPLDAKNYFGNCYVSMKLACEFLETENLLTNCQVPIKVYVIILSHT